MNTRILSISAAALIGFGSAILLPAGELLAQSGEGQTAREAAPIDMTGYWVAVVTEDWRFRMVRPPHGDYNSVPLNDEGRRVADTWDSERDAAAGEECRSYGAASIMSVPGRLRISWEDEDTLRVDTDAAQDYLGHVSITHTVRYTELSPHKFKGLWS